MFVLLNLVMCFVVKNQVDSSERLSERLIEEIKQASMPTGKESKPWPWWVIKGFLNESAIPDVVVFGSSQMGSALATTEAEMLNRWVDVVVHRRIHFLEKVLARTSGAKVNVLALSSPGQMVSDGWLLSNLLFQQNRVPKLAVITIAPRDFIDYTLPYPAATEVFNLTGKYLPGQNRISNYLYTEPFALLDYWLKQLPLKKLGEIWSMPLLQDANKGTGMQADQRQGHSVLNAVAGANGDVSQGVWVVPPQFPDIWQDNTKEYKLRFKDPFGPKYSAEMFFLRKWLELLRKRDIAVVVVGMPSLKMNRDLLTSDFWQQFHRDIAEICEKNEAVWSDLSSSNFQKEDFLDTVHLNARGGKKLFNHIGEVVAKQDRLKGSLPGQLSRSLKSK